MSLQVQNANNVKIYTVSGSKGSRSIPDWLARRNKKALKNDLGTLNHACYRSTQVNRQCNSGLSFQSSSIQLIREANFLEHFFLFLLVLEWRHRIELIQDFEFPEASLKIRTTRDGKYVMATGKCMS